MILEQQQEILQYVVSCLCKISMCVVDLPTKLIHYLIHQPSFGLSSILCSIIVHLFVLVLLWIPYHIYAFPNCKYVVLSPGMQVMMPDVLIVGRAATLTCSSDLDVTMTEWLLNGRAVQNSTHSQVQLLFNPVMDTIHSRQYTCRVTSPYGIQEQTIIITAEGRFK